MNTLIEIGNNFGPHIHTTILVVLGAFSVGGAMLLMKGEL